MLQCFTVPSWEPDPTGFAATCAHRASTGAATASRIPLLARGLVALITEASLVRLIAGAAHPLSPHSHQAFTMPARWRDVRTRVSDSDPLGSLITWVPRNPRRDLGSRSRVPRREPIKAPGPPPCRVVADVALNTPMQPYGSCRPAKCSAVLTKASIPPKSLTFGDNNSEFLMQLVRFYN